MSLNPCSSSMISLDDFFENVSFFLSVHGPQPILFSARACIYHMESEPGIEDGKEMEGMIPASIVSANGIKFSLMEKRTWDLLILSSAFALQEIYRHDFSPSRY